MMGHKPKVLIVDDFKTNILMIKAVLEDEGYEFYEANNGKEAIDIAIEVEPDVILMDAVMPEVDGFEATRMIRNNVKLERTPILMVTSLSEKSSKINALEVGVNDFVSKPFDESEFIARCRSYVNMSLLNKSYVNATVNPYTGLMTKSVLLEDIDKSTHPNIILFWINGFEDFEEFYGEAVIQSIEQYYANIFKNNVSFKGYKNYYHTSKGEFALLMDDATLDDIALEDFAKKILAFTEKDDFYIQEQGSSFDIHITLSFIGHMENMYEKARTSLKQGQKQHKNIVNAKNVIEEVYKEVSNNITWTHKIKEALAEDRIKVFYQALYNNQTKEIEKYECLVRLIEKDGKVISPFFFLDIAQKSKYYLEITKRVFDQACETFSTLDKEFSINLSGIDIEDDTTRQYIIDHLKKNPNIAKKIVFELLEDENFKDFKILREFINEVKSMGAQIAIDDFGSGYSNFIRLLDFQPDILKIDGSLVKNIATDEFSLNVVKTVKDFADKIGIKTVAEFVSDEAIQNIIQDLNIDYSQGYYITEPLPLEKL